MERFKKNKNSVFIVAELSGNHNQSFETAKKLVRAACGAGADAVKVQVLNPETITLNSDKKWFKIKANNAWKGQNLFDLYKKICMPWKWLPELKKIAEKKGVMFFASVFDEAAVDFCEKMGIGLYKIASFELVDTGLLKKIAATGKPVIISRGMATLEELKLARSTLKNNGSGDIAILHCVSSYPAKTEEMNLATIKDLQRRFKKCNIGLSDHTLGTLTSVAAVAMGASIIEKHITLSRKDGGPDACFSMEPEEFKDLTGKIREAEKSIGKVQYGAGKKEAENIIFRRSLFAVRNIKRGEKFTKENVRSIRPGCGLQPKYFPKVIKGRAKKNISLGTPLTSNLITWK